MIYSEQTKRAARLAYSALRNKITLEGMPAILDWFIIAHQCPDENTTVAALLHGAVDSGVFDLAFVKSQGFPEDAIYALELLLLHKELPYEKYIELLAARRYSSMKKPIGDNKSSSCLTRVAPFVLYHKNADSKNDHVKHEMHLAASSAALTHGHPLAWLSSAFLAQILSRTIYGGCTIGDTLNLYLWEGKRLVYELLGNSEHLRALFAIIDKAISLVDNDEDDVENIIKLGSGWDAHECLAIALYCCLRHPMDFRMAVLAASNHPGNTAATACLTGQIMGAKLGYSRIDPSWVNALERQNVILEIADDLIDECQLHRFGEYDDPKWRSKYQYCDFTL